MAQAGHPGQGHRGRLRERFLAHGLAKFTDAEVLELLLTLATPRRDCKQQARALLDSLGSLWTVLEAEPQILGRVEGLGPKNILGLKLVPAVARRYLEDRLQGQGPLPDASAALDYLTLTMGSLEREVFRLLLLDGSRRVKASEDLFWGTIDQAAVYPREVISRALAVGASAVICAHNHPGGDPQPSPDDRAITRRLYYALRLAGLELLDHVIVGQQSFHSFSREGYLDRLAAEYQQLAL